jgi:5-methylthioadenosine/S-adenosylhomocysteine deaminase
MSVTCIRQAAWVIAWSRTAQAHVYMNDIDIAFSEDGVHYMGRDYIGSTDQELDGTDRLVMPGLVNIHSHPSAQPIFRGLTEEFGNPRLFYSSRHALKQSLYPDEAAMRASAEFALAEMLAGGVTTVVDLSHPYPGWLDILAASGMRVCVAPMYRSARWYTDTGQATKYDWHEEKGWKDFDEAKDLMDQADRHPSGRLFSMVAPAQVDTCSEELLRSSRRYAEQTNRPLHVHAAQSYAEFQEMTRRNDMTPVEWLHRIGFLSERTILGHAVFTDQHPWLHWPTRRDVQLLHSTGTSVAHCPTVFARDGTVMHSLGRYHAAGVNLAIGTDTHPHNLLEELRWAEILARVADGPRHQLGTKRVFEFATLGGSRALLRDDLGRLAPGYPADLVLVDLCEPTMLPLYDPLRSLIYGAADRAVRDVFVAGRQVVSNGKVLTLKRDAAAQALQQGQQRAIAAIPQHDASARKVDTIMPRTLPLVKEL